MVMWAGSAFTVGQWLATLGLEQYTRAFETSGFDRLDAIKELDQQDLAALGVKRGHVKVLLSQAKALKETHGTAPTQPPSYWAAPPYDVSSQSPDHSATAMYRTPSSNSCVTAVSHSVYQWQESGWASGPAQPRQWWHTQHQRIEAEPWQGFEGRQGDRNDFGSTSGVPLASSYHEWPDRGQTMAGHASNVTGAVSPRQAGPPRYPTPPQRMAPYPISHLHSTQPSARHDSTVTYPRYYATPSYYPPWSHSASFGHEPIAGQQAVPLPWSAPPGYAGRVTMPTDKDGRKHSSKPTKSANKRMRYNSKSSKTNLASTPISKVLPGSWDQSHGPGLRLAKAELGAMKSEGAALCLAPRSLLRKEEQETVVCSLCGKGENTESLGELDGPYGQDREGIEIWVHEDCAVWSPEFFIDPTTGEPNGLTKIVNRGKKLRCSYCSKKGATIGCRNATCKRSFHYLCIALSGGYARESDYYVLCSAHKESVPDTQPSKKEGEGEKEDERKGKIGGKGEGEGGAKNSSDVSASQTSTDVSTGS